MLERPVSGCRPSPLELAIVDDKQKLTNYIVLDYDDNDWSVTNVEGEKELMLKRLRPVGKKG